jgi:hypothetical protein
LNTLEHSTGAWLPDSRGKGLIDSEQTRMESVEISENASKKSPRRMLVVVDAAMSAHHCAPRDWRNRGFEPKRVR